MAPGGRDALYKHHMSLHIIVHVGLELITALFTLCDSDCRRSFLNVGVSIKINQTSISSDSVLLRVSAFDSQAYTHVVEHRDEVHQTHQLRGTLH